MAKESGKRQRDSMGARRGGRYSVSLSCLGDLPGFLCFHVSCSMRFQLWFLIGSFICQMKNCISWVLFTIPCYYSPFWNAEDAVNNYVSWPSKNYPKKVWCPSRHAPENIENPSGPAVCFASFQMYDAPVLEHEVHSRHSSGGEAIMVNRQWCSKSMKIIPRLADDVFGYKQNVKLNTQNDD